MDGREKRESAERYEQSVREFERIQGSGAKEINMTAKSKNGMFQKLKTKFKKDDNNYIIGRNGLEDRVKWISLQRVYLAAGLVLLIAFTGFGWGISNNRQAEQRLEETNGRIKETKMAVQGNHLINIPKDYSAWAEGQDVNNKKEKILAKVETSVADDVNDVETVVVPAGEKTLVYDTYADRAHQRDEELRLKAKESPIAFEIKGEN